jgi:hypothetical protein
MARRDGAGLRYALLIPAVEGPVLGITVIAGKCGIWIDCGR